MPCAQETVGQHLFLIVSALTQQTAKGPVDCVTEKALYTLSEDWLLWQAQDFATLVLTFLFPETPNIFSSAWNWKQQSKTQHYDAELSHIYPEVHFISFGLFLSLKTLKAWR